MIEFPKEGLFELSDESAAPLTAEVQHGQDDDLIEVQAGLALPDDTEGEVSLLRSQVAEPRQQTPFHGIEKIIGKELTLVVGPGEIK